MGGRRLTPFRFNPRTVVDGEQPVEGGLLALTNLIFDPAEPFTMQCRPATVEEYDFADDYTDPVFVSVAFQAGEMCYGMIASDDEPGYDMPFAYNVATGTFVTVTGTQDNTTLPQSQTSTGTWNPPTMDLVGPLLYVTHPGFPGGVGAFFGWFDITNPAAPVWNSGNTGVNALPAVPVCVSQFNNRAWFTVDNAVWFTDALTTNISNASNVLIVGDNIDITGTAPQPLVTSVQGIIQSLAVFKPNAIALITGDSALGNLALNIIDSSTGCEAIRTVAPTPKGLKFMAKDGIRTINKQGTLEDPNPDLKVPFINALIPSRASAGYSNNIYRITVENGAKNNNPLEEYWFDERQNGWSGPHTFTQDMVVPYANGFVAFNSQLAPKLWVSQVVQDGNSLYVENGEDMTFLYQTAPLPDDGGMYENSAVLSVIDLQLPNDGSSYTFAASDVYHGFLSSASINAPEAGYLWGGATTWEGGVWTYTEYGLERYNIPWTEPLVFSRMVFQASGPSSQAFRIAKLVIGYQPLNYVRIF
jgi:hypothetical protein